MLDLKNKKWGGNNMKLTKSQLKEMIKEELKLTEDYKNSEWEVYVADEKGREKVVKVAKSKRAGVILYNKLINSDKYHEVGMRVKGYNEGLGEGKLNEDDFASKYVDMISDITKDVNRKSSKIVRILNQQDKITGTKNARAYNALIDTHFRKFIAAAQKITAKIKD
tara:strand:+ start:526 stop:1023 length:498 start_codon:yes stop_codon:yes gene_type:complete